MVVRLSGAVVLLCAIGTAVAESSSWQSNVLSMVDTTMHKMDNFDLGNGIILKKTKEEVVPRSLDEDFGTTLANRVSSFLQSHVVQIDLSGVDVQGIGRSITDLVAEPRGKKNKMKMKKPKDIVLPILIAVKAKMIILSAMMGNMIAMIAGKALILGKIALILGGMLFLKKLISTPPKDITHFQHKKIVADDQIMYEKPGGGPEDWEQTHGRTDYFPQPGPSAQEMAYAGQIYKPLK